MALMPGFFTARVLSHTWTTSSKGSVGLAVKIAVPGDTGDEEEIVGTIWITEAAMGMARSQFKAFGFDVDSHELTELDDGRLLVGREVNVELAEEEFKDEWRVKVKRFGGNAKPTQDALQKAQTALRNAKKTNRDKTATAPTAAPTPPAKPAPPPQQQPKSELAKEAERMDEEDSIPF